MALYTMQNLVLLIWAPFAVIFGVPALGLGWVVVSHLRRERRTRRLERKLTVIRGLGRDANERAA